MTTLNAKDFKTRSDLENVVRNKVGLTPDSKPEWVISGTRKELLQLRLSDRTIFWGIRCEITDAPTVDTPKTDVDRGPLQNFGENGNRSKKPII